MAPGTTRDIESQNNVEDDVNLPLKQKLNDMLWKPPPLPSKCCIIRVPKRLCTIKESAYTPRVISIGPFHHNKDEFQFMEKQKVIYLRRCIHKYSVNLDDLLTYIRKMEGNIRRSYEEQIKLSSDDLVMMVLLDGIFVIEYFRRYCYPDLKDDKEPTMLYRLKIRHSIFVDLILLENQLPFFVLESLYNLLFPNSLRAENEQLSFSALSYKFFSSLTKRAITKEVIFSLGNFHLEYLSEKALHFTDLIRMLYLLDYSPSQLMQQQPSSSTTHHPETETETETETDRYISSYSANELEERGVIFKASSSKCLIDIQFTVNGLFIIPQLEIDDSTESVFRNIMALEQHMFINRSYICDYVHLMDTLINTCKDVELLVRKGIITNHIGDDEKVAALFNNLNNEIVLGGDLENSYFYKIRQDSTNYSKKFWPKSIASFRRDYWSTPWQIASVSAAFVLLVLTLVQAICSIMQVLPLY